MTDPLARFRELVAASRLTTAQIAERAGMDRRQLHRLLKDAENPGILTVARVLAAINKTLADLER